MFWNAPFCCSVSDGVSRQPRAAPDAVEAFWKHSFAVGGAPIGFMCEADAGNPGVWVAAGMSERQKRVGTAGEHPIPS